jgi:S-formylglutathione hydrolase FrmB
MPSLTPDRRRRLLASPVLFVFVATIFLITITASYAFSQRDLWLRGSTETIRLEGGSRVEFHEFRSEALGGTAKYSIFFPPSYDRSEKTYPAVYFLHGLFNDHTSWTMDRHGNIPELLDARMAAGDLPEIVLVHPDGERSFYTNSHDGKHRYEDLVVSELPKHIEARYRVASVPSQRGISGTSMGGFGALKIAMRHPDRYAAVAAHSPIVFPANNPLDVPEQARQSRQYQFISGVFGEVFGVPFDQAYYDENNPLVLASQRQLSRLGIYFDYGTADRYNRSVGLGQGLERLAATLSAADVEHRFVTYEGEPHGWALVFDHILQSLRFIAEHFS